MKSCYYFFFAIHRKDCFAFKKVYKDFNKQGILISCAARDTCCEGIPTFFLKKRDEDFKNQGILIRYLLKK